MPFILRRLLETIGGHLVLSLIFSLLFRFGVLKQSRGIVLLMMFLCIILNLVFMFICLKGYLISVMNIKTYFAVNFLVLLIFCSIAIPMAAFDIEPLYTFMFFPFKFLNTVFELSKTVSALISSAFLFVYVAIAPLFMILPLEEPEEEV